jgi:hypothetical protein
MPRLAMQTPHNLGREEASRRLKDKFRVVRDKYGSQVNNLQEKWDNHTFSFDFKAMGMGVSGTVHVEDDGVRLNVDLPLAAMIFKGAIQRQIQQELNGLLA